MVVIPLTGVGICMFGAVWYVFMDLLTNPSYNWDFGAVPATGLVLPQARVCVC